MAPQICTRESRYYCIRIIDFSRQAGSDAKLMVLDHLGHGINVADRPQQLITPYIALIDAVLTERLKGKPASSYFIGGGAYTLPRAWKAAAPASRITVSEIDPEVTALARDEMWFQESGITILHDDARAALRAAGARYQVIIGDAFTDIAVPPHLVTLEFFQLVASKLEPGGIYAMNVVDHAGRTPALLAVYRTLKAVFGSVEVFAEEGHLAAGGRTTFVLFAAGNSSGIGRMGDPQNPDREFVRLSPARLDRLVISRKAALLTDDHAPIDRLVGIGEL